MRCVGWTLVAGMKCLVEALQQLDLPGELLALAVRLDEVESADGIVDGQRLLVRSEESRGQCLLRATPDGDEVRQRHVLLAQFLRDDGAQARERHGAGAILVTGVQIVGGQLVVRLQRAHAAQDRGVLHQLREAREMLADADARHRRFDGLEFAADVGRSLGLRVEGVDVAGPAGHPQQDARLGPLSLRRRRRETAEPAVE